VQGEKITFSTYKSKKELGEVLRKYGIDSGEITKIPPFEPEPVEIDDEDEVYNRNKTQDGNYRFGNGQE
jgi:hypothetical protein